MASPEKNWRFRFKFHKKEKLLALGVYPAVRLAEARRRRDKARALLDEGIDPTAQRRNVKQEASLRFADTFAGLANDWFQTEQDSWSPRYASDTRKFVDRERGCGQVSVEINNLTSSYAQNRRPERLPERAKLSLGNNPSTRTGQAPGKWIFRRHSRVTLAHPEHHSVAATVRATIATALLPLHEAP